MGDRFKFFGAQKNICFSRFIVAGGLCGTHFADSTWRSCSERSLAAADSTAYQCSRAPASHRRAVGRKAPVCDGLLYLQLDELRVFVEVPPAHVLGQQALSRTKLLLNHSLATVERASVAKIALLSPQKTTTGLKQVQRGPYEGSEEASESCLCLSGPGHSRSIPSPATDESKQTRASKSNNSKKFEQIKF